MALLALVATAVMIGAGYEAKMRRQAVAEHPAPGRLVDIGGRKIQLDCRGSGSPVVVLEAGLDMNGSLAWAKVHDSLWYVSATYTAERAAEIVRHAQDQNDKLIVVDATNNNAAWYNLPQNVGEHIQQNWHRQAVTASAAGLPTIPAGWR